MSLFTNIVTQWCNFNYKRKINQLKKDIKKRKIRVLFYVTENSKWGYQSLYDLMNASDKFEPIVVVSILKEAFRGKDNTRNILEENFNFFKSRGMNVEYGFKNDEFVNLKTFKPDIIFYEQPWGLMKSHKSPVVCTYALTALCPYSFQIFNYKSDYMKSFHKHIFKVFTDSELNIQRYESYGKGNSKNCVAVGYPKLDVYLVNDEIDSSKYWKNPERIKIIYAPHHSFEKGGIEAATFKENGKFILEFAKQNPETTWIFKPHPRLQYALVSNNIMSQEEVQEYYEEWDKIGKTYTQGDYFGIFKSSDLMITDCCSFLAEYLPTLKPLIRLVSPNVISLNKVGEKVLEANYQVYSNNEFVKMFENLMTKKEDSKKNTRENIAKNIIDFDKKSSQKVMDEILRVLGAN